MRATTTLLGIGRLRRAQGLLSLDRISYLYVSLYCPLNHRTTDRVAAAARQQSLPDLPACTCALETTWLCLALPSSH